MGNKGKSFSLLLIIIFAVSSLTLLIIKPTNAQTIPPVSPPQLTVKFVDRSYTVPITTWTTTDPFNGSQITKSSGGNYVTNRTIDVTITNQPFTPIILDNGTIIQLYYSVRTKGHFEDWNNINGEERMYKMVPETTSEFTTITLILDPTTPPYYDVPNGGQEDFQVKAQAGYEYPYYGEHIIPLYTAFENLTESDWSNTQTISVGQATLPSTTPTSTTTSSPTVPELSWFAVLPLILSAGSVAVMFRHRKNNNQTK